MKSQEYVIKYDEMSKLLNGRDCFDRKNRLESENEALFVCTIFETHFLQLNLFPGFKYHVI